MKIITLASGQHMKKDPLDNASDIPDPCPDDSFYHTPSETCVGCGPLCRDQPLSDVDREFCRINCPELRTCGPGEFYHPIYTRCLPCSSICGQQDDPDYCRNQCGDSAWNYSAGAHVDYRSEVYNQIRESKSSLNSHAVETYSSVPQGTELEVAINEGWSNVSLAAVISLSIISAVMLCLLAVMVLRNKLRKNNETDHLDERQSLRSSASVEANTDVGGVNLSDNGHPIVSDTDPVDEPGRAEREAWQNADINAEQSDSRDQVRLAGTLETSTAVSPELNLISCSTGSETDLLQSERSPAVAALQNKTYRKQLH